MKRIVESDEVSGFESVLGERIEVWCGVYIYTGILSGVNEDHIELTEPYVVYETGELTAPRYKDAQRCASPRRVMRQAIESWGPSK